MKKGSIGYALLITFVVSAIITTLMTLIELLIGSGTFFIACLIAFPITVLWLLIQDKYLVKKKG